MSSLKVFELEEDEWKLVFHQKDIGMSRVFEIKAYIEDYNFDGVNDIGLKNEVSNGTGIMSFHLWLNDNDTFIEVPEFRNIGNPTIIKKKNRIQGYSACCAFSEMNITNFEWNDTKLREIDLLEISNYPTREGIKAKIIDKEGITQKNVKISEQEINIIIDKFSSNWNLLDTTAKIGFASGEVTFFY